MSLYPYDDWAGSVVDRLNTLARENSAFSEVKCGDDVLAMLDKLINDRSSFNQIRELCGASLSRMDHWPEDCDNLAREILEAIQPAP
jgi:hypothetical protein